MSEVSPAHVLPTATKRLTVFLKAPAKDSLFTVPFFMATRTFSDALRVSRDPFIRWSHVWLVASSAIYFQFNLQYYISGFMWTPYLPVRDRTQTGTRRTSCHEPRNRNRHAAWRVFSAFFRSKRRLSVNLGLAPACVPSGLYQPGTPPSTEILWRPT